MKPLRLSKILFIALLISLTTNAKALKLYATGVNQNDPAGGDILYELNPDNGALIQEIGNTGYSISGLAYDAVNGVMYALSFFDDPNYSNGLLIIDLETGNATPIGDGLNEIPTTTLTANSNGELFSHSESDNKLVTFDKATGASSEVGSTGILYTEYTGLAFDNNDELYLNNSANAQIHRLDPTTGAEITNTNLPFVAPYGLAYQGTFNPETNELYNLLEFRGDPTQSIGILEKNGDSFAYLQESYPTVPGIFTLAFVPTPPPNPEPAPGVNLIEPEIRTVPTTSLLVLGMIGLGLTLLVFKRRFK